MPFEQPLFIRIKKLRASLSFPPPRYKPLGGNLLRPFAQRLKFTVYLWSHTFVCSRRNFERNLRKIFAAELPQVAICSISGILAAFPFGVRYAGWYGYTFLYTGLCPILYIGHIRFGMNIANKFAYPFRSVYRRTKRGASPCFRLRPPTRTGAPLNTLRKRLFADTLREPRSTRNRSSSLVPLSLDKNPSFSGADYI